MTHGLGLAYKLMHALVCRFAAPVSVDWDWCNLLR